MNTRTLCLCLLLLSACNTVKEQVSLDDPQIVNNENEVNPFSLPEVGAYSNMATPKNIKIIPASRFINSLEPTFAEVIGSEIGTFDFENFCSEKDFQLDFLKGIVMNCKIVNDTSPHVEYYFAHYNPYNEDYFLIGKYALFKTKSKVYPALLVWMPKNPSEDIDVSSAEQIKNYFSSEIISSSDSKQERIFDTFVRSIQIQPIENEQEWLLHTDNELHYSIEYPIGVGRPSERSFYGAGTSIGIDGQYTITFFKDKNELNKFISSLGTQFKNRKEIRTPAQIGSYKAEKIVIHPQRYPQYIISSKNGYFLLSFNNLNSEDDMYLNHMLSSFKIFE